LEKGGSPALIYFHKNIEFETNNPYNFEMTHDLNDNRRFLKSLLFSAENSLFVCVGLSDEQQAISKTVTAGYTHRLSSRIIDLRALENPHDLTLALKNNPDQNALTHLVGGNEWLKRELVEPGKDGDCKMPFSHRVNLARENIFAIPGRKVFWLNDEGVGHLAKEAPDFWSWRAGVYRIDPQVPLALTNPSAPKP